MDKHDREAYHDMGWLIFWLTIWATLALWF